MIHAMHSCHEHINVVHVTEHVQGYLPGPEHAFTPAKACAEQIKPHKVIAIVSSSSSVPEGDAETLIHSLTAQAHAHRWHKHSIAF
jgi:hypothetical protein